ncbi:MAG: cytochrome c maturation protein CcmE, partial [Alsobacter sp.]
EFKADSVLAKHDETYMPKEVADALKKQGVWQEDGKAGGAPRPAPAAQGTKP